MTTGFLVQHSGAKGQCTNETLALIAQSAGPSVTPLFGPSNYACPGQYPDRPTRSPTAVSEHLLPDHMNNPDML